jgi:hypothetical protein
MRVLTDDILCDEGYTLLVAFPARDQPGMEVGDALQKDDLIHALRPRQGLERRVDLLSAAARKLPFPLRVGLGEIQEMPPGLDEQRPQWTLVDGRVADQPDVRGATRVFGRESSPLLF